MARLNQISALCSLAVHLEASREEILAFQSKQLRRLVAHAYDRVPYYRRLFDQNGLKPQDIRTVADLSAIPITSKKDLQQLPKEEVVARGVAPQRLIVHKTSGSSGMPFTIRRTWWEERLLGALRLRALRGFGLIPRDRRAGIVLLRPSHSRDSQLPLRILQVVGLYRAIRIHCLLEPEAIVQRLRRFRPEVITGISGVLSRIAQAMTDDDRHVIRPRFVASGGEVLTPLMRRQISEAFRTQVFNTYGSHEFNLIAWECKETGEYHTCDDGMIVEVLKNGRPAAPGERGEVIGTNLHSFAMPFLRYRLGDIVTRGCEVCSCRKPFSTIRAIQGRIIDYLVLPDGRRIHPYEFSLILVDDVPWIRQYRLVQEREDRIVLEVVPLGAPPAEKLAAIQAQVAKLLGRSVDFQVVLVPEIPPDDSGKFRVVRSFVNSHCDGIDWRQL